MDPRDFSPTDIAVIYAINTAAGIAKMWLQLVGIAMAVLLFFTFQFSAEVDKTNYDVYLGSKNDPRVKQSTYVNWKYGTCTAAGGHYVSNPPLYMRECIGADLSFENFLDVYYEREKLISRIEKRNDSIFHWRWLGVEPMEIEIEDKIAYSVEDDYPTSH